MKTAHEANDPEAMQAAARLNWRLWTIFQSELLDPHCPVPDEVRLNILSLARFVDSRTLDFLSDPAAEKLSALISINRELAGGLYSDPNAANAASSASQPAEAVLPPS
ncbi:MAG: hypothetical protein HC834_07145, partial [Rhodospirillales bacterium]|nr:hypothetical protein [Rhodospirillales bacterium]